MPADPSEIWTRLPDAQWDAAAARHLLRRAAWAATPQEVERATAEGLDRTLDRLFPAEAPRPPEPSSVSALEEDTPAFMQKLRQAKGTEKKELQREARERAQGALHDLTIEWLRFAAQPEQSASAKWVFFLSDVYVVAADKVRNPALLWQHFDTLSRHAFGPAPVLTKAVSRSPAMIRYLDLDQNKRGAPNENFARELFELFLLGEGNYSEHDIKESARAFTGYRTRFGEFFLAARQHDAGTKTVFASTGRLAGDDVIDLAYRQPAAGTFLPHELVKFYLSDTPLAPEQLAPLGSWWSENSFALRALAHRFFGSRMFFAPEFRGALIKSPVQYYLGLLQELDLDVPPLPRRIIFPLRLMGQMPFNPPNVRGWVGGRSWINSATLAARRTLVESLFAPLREETLNADERRALSAARAAGNRGFTIGEDGFTDLSQLDSTAAARHLATKFLPHETAPEIEASLRQFLERDDEVSPAQRARRLRRGAVALLQSPEYQLC
ncbi:MAG TPA: DUF1800 domain-containing protein [Opitutus sp.]|nr:DUF1800 domain-containing protein [Opitutus sp.]